MGQAEAFEASRPLVHAFERLGIDYLIGGSLASSFHGRPRSTQDVDLVADLKASHVPPLVAELEDRYYLDADRMMQAIRERSSFNIIYLPTMFKVDVFVLKDEPLASEEMRRRQRIELGDEEVDLATAEDTILQKLLWYRRGGETSQRQWDDLLGVLKVQGNRLDFEYLDTWAEHVEVADLLERARLDAGL